MAADLVVVGARVVSVAERGAPASAVAVERDRIVAVGTDDDVADLIGPSTEVVEGNARTLLPGFVDAHNHVRLGSNANAVGLFGATSIEEIRERIAARAAADPAGDWIEGEGWNYAAVPGG